MDTRSGFASGVKHVILKKFEDIQRRWSNPTSLPLRLFIPDIGKVVYDQPKLITLGMNKVSKKNFRLEDHAKKADIDTLRHMQKLLNQKIPEEADFIVARHIKLEKQGKKRFNKRSEDKAREKK